MWFLNRENSLVSHQGFTVLSTKSLQTELGSRAYDVL